MRIILNRVKNKKYELTKNEVRQFVELPVIGVVPEDENVLKGVNKKELVTISNNKSPASKAFFSIASYLTGVQLKFFSVSCPQPALGCLVSLKV